SAACSSRQSRTRRTRGLWIEDCELESSEGPEETGSHGEAEQRRQYGEEARPGNCTRTRTGGREGLCSRAIRADRSQRCGLVARDAGCSVSSPCLRDSCETVCSAVSASSGHSRSALKFMR